MHNHKCTTTDSLSLSDASPFHMRLSVHAQAQAISDGALPKCEYIYVQENDFDQSGKQFLKAATKPRGIRVHFGWPPPLPGVEYD